MSQRYFKPKQLAAYLGICERQVRYWMAEGVLPYVKIGRRRLITRQHLQQFLGAAS